MKLAIVGATGLVGTELLSVIKESDLEYSELILVASARSVGKKIRFQSNEYQVIGLQEALELGPDIAIFSCGSGPSREWAPKFAEQGCFVIDNSSAWRMDADKCLVVPEVNAHVLNENDRIIANPNCSTIQMVVALAPLHREYGIKRLVISTYQSYTGTGAHAVKQYEDEKAGQRLDYSQTAYPHPIFANCLPHCGEFDDSGYTTEEIKLVNETRKIIGDQSIKITATTVRVPVSGGHSESVNVEFLQPFELKDVKKLLSETEGVTLKDDFKNNEYPMPLMARHKDDVFIGRIRRDDSIDNGLNLWIVSDNLRKGAATNAVQIAQYICAKEFITNKVSL